MTEIEAIALCAVAGMSVTPHTFHGGEKATWDKTAWKCDRGDGCVVSLPQGAYSKLESLTEEEIKLISSVQNPLREQTDGSLIIVKVVKVGANGDGCWHPLLGAFGIVHGHETYDSYKSRVVYMSDEHDSVIYEKVSISWGPDGGSSRRAVLLSREKMLEIMNSHEPNEVHEENGDVEHYWYVGK